MSNGQPSWFKGLNVFTGNSMMILGLILICSIGVVTGALITERFWGNRGRIVGIGIDLYWDQALTDVIEDGEEYDWGEIEAGESSTMTLYCSNTGNVPVYLTMYNQDHDPASIQQYLIHSWDYNGIAIPVNGSRRVIFTLGIDTDTPPTNLFRFTTYIVAEDSTTP